MGNNLNINSKIRGLIMKTKTANSQIGEVSHCPNCDLQFPPNTTYETVSIHLYSLTCTSKPAYSPPNNPKKSTPPKPSKSTSKKVTKNKSSKK